MKPKNNSNNSGMNGRNRDKVLTCSACGVVNTGEHVYVHESTETDSMSYATSGSDVYKQSVFGYTVYIEKYMTCQNCEAETTMETSWYVRNESVDREINEEKRREKEEEEERRRRGEYIPESYECDCPQCLPRYSDGTSETCMYPGCSKPATHAYLVAVFAIDTSADRIYRACDDKEHMRYADNEAYKDEHDGRSIPGYNTHLHERYGKKEKEDDEEEEEEGGGRAR